MNISTIAAMTGALLRMLRKVARSKWDGPGGARQAGWLGR